MNCNLFYVAEKLGVSDSLTLYAPDRAMVTCVQTYEDVCDAADPVLVVIHGDRKMREFVQLKEHAVNVAWIRDPDDTMVPPEDLNLLIIDDGMTVESLQEAVQGVLRDRFVFEDHMNRCLEALSRGEGLQVLVDQVYDHFGFPMAVSKSNGIIDVVTSDYHSPVSFIETNLQTKYVDDEIYEKLEYRERRQHMTATRGAAISIVKVTTSDGESLDVHFLDQAITYRGETIGYTSTASLQAMTEWQKDCIQKYNRMAATVMMNRYRQDEQKETALETMISDILTGTLKDRQMMELRLKRIEPETKPYHHLILVRSRSPELPRVKTTSMLRLKNMFRRAPVIRSGDDLVIVYHSSEDYFSLDDRMKERLEGYLRVENLVMGVSRMFTDYADIPTCYEQAEKAVYYGLKSHWEGVIFLYEQYMHFHAFEMLSGMVRPEWITNRQLSDLCRSEDAQDQELVQTLRLWLRYNKDVRHVTEELHIHRNTLYYRLNKIKELLHFESYDSGEVIFYLQWSLAFEDYQKMIKG